MRILAVSAVVCLVPATLCAQRAEPKFRRVVVDPAFRSEGIACADADRDGDLDLFVGDFWYEAPNWAQHRIRKGPPLGDGAHTYSECFICYADDLDRDGFPDQIVVGFPGKQGRWYRNPGKPDGEWEMRVFADSVSNESPQWVDLLGTGQKGMLSGTQPTGEIVWVAPGKDPTSAWERIVIGGPKSPGSEPFSHGIGCGDVDGDGRFDVMVQAGYWSQPKDPRQGPWSFTKADLGVPCAHMHALDADGDGLIDVFSSSAHARGVFWHQQVRAEAGSPPRFVSATIATEPTQTHALCVADLDGDGRVELITGKRWWAHGPEGDEDPKGTPLLLWIGIEPAATPGTPPKFVPHVIDDASGVGTCFQVVDLNGDGRLDIATSNKRGVFVFLQEPVK